MVALPAPAPEQVPYVVDGIWKYDGALVTYSSRKEDMTDLFWAQEGTLFVNRAVIRTEKFGARNRPGEKKNKGGRPGFRIGEDPECQECDRAHPEFPGVRAVAQDTQCATRGGSEIDDRLSARRPLDKDRASLHVGWRGREGPMTMRIAIAAMVVLAAFAADDGPQPRVVTPGKAVGDRPSDAVTLFDGHDLSHWMKQDGSPPGCTMEDVVMVCKTGEGHMVSKDKFHDAQIHVEFRIPSMPDQHGQLRGNSGIVLHGIYEVQILDSYQNPTYADGSCGSYYGHNAPLVNVSRPPEEWQSYDIVFHGPKCGSDGKLIDPGSLTVMQNGVLVQDHVTLHDRRSCQEGSGDPGPLVLQEHHPENPPMTVMRFRNIWLRSLE